MFTNKKEKQTKQQSSDIKLVSFKVDIYMFSNPNALADDELTEEQSFLPPKTAPYR